MVEKTHFKEPERKTEMLRTTVAAVGGVRIIYTLPTGEYLGEVTVLSTGAETSKVIAADAAAFLPSFLDQQARLAQPIMRRAS
jgi:hypothetical protein